MPIAEVEILQEWHVLAIVIAGFAGFIFAISKWRTEKDMQILSLSKQQDKIVLRLDAILKEVQAVAVTIGKIETEQENNDRRLERLESQLLK